MDGPWAMTAAGLVTPAGDGVETVFESLLNPRANDPTGTIVSTEGESVPVRSVADFDPRTYLKRKGLKHLSRTSQLACAAAARIQDGLEGTAKDRIGVVLGTAWASLDSVVRFEREAHTEGPRFVDPILFTETVANVPAGQVSIAFGWSALNATVANGSASGLEALRGAIRFLDEERAGIVVAGGSDELNRHLLRTLHAERFTSADLTLPLSAEARGPVGGEGACLIGVERVSDARARGATVRGRILSTASGPIADAEPDRSASIARLLRRLLASAECPPEQVDLLVLSANGDPVRDRAEIEAHRHVFGRSMPPAILPKAVLGECWAASGPVGVAIATEAMRRGVVPPRPAGWVSAGEFSDVALPERPVEGPLGTTLVGEFTGAATGAAVLLGAAG